MVRSYFEQSTTQGLVMTKIRKYGPKQKKRKNYEQEIIAQQEHHDFKTIYLSKKKLKPTTHDFLKVISKCRNSLND